jgi:CHAT domain
MNDKIKVLFLSANPGLLRSDREVREIDDRIRRAPYGSAFEVASVWAVRATDVTDALLRHSPQIVHFSGHGEKQSGIFLEDDRGRPIAITGEMLSRLFEALRGTIRVVILNACETRPLAEVLRHLIDYTISMRQPITDEAAIVFASAFYSALAHRQDVPAAFNLALAQLDLSQIPEADIPDLMTRPGITPEELVPTPKEQPPERGAQSADQVFNFTHSQVKTFIGKVNKG